jgi:tetratricopeptide (TPR) repeat protein
MKFITKKNLIISSLFIVLLIGGIYGYLYYINSNKSVFIDHEKLADEYYSTKQYSQAAYEYKLYIETDSKANSGYLKLSEIYWKKNLTKEAFEVLNECKNICNFNYHILTRLINYQIQSGNYNDALANIDEITKQLTTERASDKVSLALLKFHVLNSLNKSDEAVAHAIEYVDSNQSTEPKLNFILSAINHDDITKAKRYLTNYPEYESQKNFVNLNSYLDSLQKDSKDENENTLLANIAREIYLFSYDKTYFIQLGNEQITFEFYNYFPQTINILNLVISQSPDYYATYNLRGLNFYHSGDLAKAKIDFERVLQLEPNDQTANLYLARIENKLSNADKSASYYKNLLEITKNDVSVLKENAEVLANLGLYVQASERYKELIKLIGPSKSNFINSVAYSNLLIEKLNKYSEVDGVLNPILNQWNAESIWTREEKPELYYDIDFNYWYSKYQLSLNELKGKIDTNGLRKDNQTFYKTQLDNLKK